MAGLATRSSCWLLLLGAVVFPWIAPLLTPWQENPQILQPARAQATWVYAWLALFTWLPFQASILGHRLRNEGMLEHFRAGGSSILSLCLQLCSAVLVWMLAVVLMACVISLTVCLPRQPEEAKLWAILVFQYAALFTVTGAPLMLLSVALGTRTSEVIAFLAPVGLLFVGLSGAAWLAPLLGGSSIAGLRSLWLALPHYHLADLTPRLVFKMGALPTDVFLSSTGCLLLQGAALCIFSRWVFRTRS
jgi:hypothetical protein